MHSRYHPIQQHRPEQSTPLESVLRKSADLNAWAAAAWIAAVWVALIVVDGVTGPHFSLNSLYLLPLCLTTWCFGRVAGLTEGVITVVITLYMNGFGDGLSAQASSVPTMTAAWNAGMRTFSVVFIILLVGAFRRAFDRERANAQIDPLTGLGNRRSFQRECRRLEASALRDNRILLCGIIDLDDFKAVNDQYGHAAGDEVLRVVAEALTSAVRAYDVTARLGGDEFAFCMAVRDEASAERKAGRIHRSLIAALNTSKWKTTCSLGAATGRSVEKILNVADGTMYIAKSTGKGACKFVAT
ncbi:GGDEF domain-containing protein [Sphingomonas sp. CFBP9021]|uniref:GGDEF domain-containing protein n=1 Tax=Sphingomonas sp. CFBP9021 TaxID=3096534 RepID=UPI002A6B3AAD|nr:GGDEF domain-containing protein [Sphingomonas sp. CFBP9021]MDY0969050.1 GGDEF domain-containing protein [Sphingomonas sp. CFBP9021]